MNNENTYTSEQYERFSSVLAEIFQLDKKELDFGIYRVMNIKRAEIEKYLNEDLKAQVSNVIEENVGKQIKEMQEELAKTIESVKKGGLDPDLSPVVRKLNASIRGGSRTVLEEQVYDHLATFFARYYDEGDFISKRRYKKDVYAIPYEGEEVKLHWANADQYYVKTTENFSDYSFKTTDGKKIKFVLKEATSEQNNNKPQSGERYFALSPFHAITTAGAKQTLEIPFVYDLFSKETKQQQLLSDAFDKIKNAVQNDFREFLSVLEIAPSDKNPDRTLLEKHLELYTAHNTFDYFIHKDLKTFLTRELDFYIKNEVVFFDDIDTQSAQRINGSLASAKAVRAIGRKIIAFLSQIEDFQKRLWLKRKFVVRSDWCVTLDRVPHELYGEVAANERQREAWVRLFAIDRITGDLATVGYSEPLSVAFLEENPHLIVDTGLFGEGFKRRLLEGMEDIDGGTGGTLVHSDNFHALMLLGERYAGRVKCIYIDPPYNTGGGRLCLQGQLSALHVAYDDGKPHQVGAGAIGGRRGYLHQHRRQRASAT